MEFILNIFQFSSIYACNSAQLVELIPHFLVPPSPRCFPSFFSNCDSSGGTYQARFTFNDDETGSSDIYYYNGSVTDPSGFSSQFNVTTNTFVITGLHCSTSYNIDVTAVNCAGVSTVNTTSFTTPQPGEL